VLALFDTYQRISGVRAWNHVVSNIEQCEPKALPSLNVGFEFMKLMGWSRIMGAITVAWLLALTGFVIYEDQSSNVFCQFDGEGATCQHIFWWWVYVAPEKFEFTLRYGRTLTTALVPLAVLWVCFGAVAWVRAGFKQTPSGRG
jgi:hypothetical protein